MTLLKYQQNCSAGERLILTIGNTMKLVEKNCVPCSGKTPPLEVDEAQRLLQGVEGWQMLEDASLLLREFTFPDFKSAFAFVSRVSTLAEQEGHHPDVAFGWGYCSIALQTHAIQALHEDDFILAAKINAIL